MGHEKLQDRLAYPPRAFRADRAAAYLGISTSKFHVLVEEGRLPKPVRLDGMTLWDRLDLDAAFERLKAEETSHRRNTVDMVLGIDGHDE
jgi:predicted DNA-binding transcriptional regulator AlpA